MKEIRYRFERDPGNLYSFQTTRSLGADAIRALQQWKYKAPFHRDFSYQPVKEDDSYLVATLRNADQDFTSTYDLNDVCDDFGLVRKFLGIEDVPMINPSINIGFSR